MVRSPAWAGDWAISQYFNDPCCRAAYAQFGYVGHNGGDIALPVGVELYAVEPGTVVEAFNDTYGYGLTVYLVGESGRGWRYGHLSRLDVATGDPAIKGQRLGLSGNSGNSTGPHLHIGMRPASSDKGNGFSGYEDPFPVLRALQQEDTQMQGIIDELNNQVAALRQEIADKNSELGALRAHELAPLRARVEDLEAQLAQRPAPSGDRLVKALTFTDGQVQEVLT